MKNTGDTRITNTGIHLGLGQGYEKALAYARELHITTAQIFTHSPRSFQFKELDENALRALRHGWEELRISPVISHCNYLINLGSPDNKTFYGSVATMKKELAYAKAFGCTYFVLHVGKHKDATLEAGMAQVVKGITLCEEDIKQTGVIVLLETVAGQGTEIGRTFDELGKLIAMIPASLREHIGVCVDTCHIFAAGYDIRTAKGVEDAIGKMDRAFGISRVKVIHVNDSKGDCGDHLDRHEHIGQGMIGADGLRAFLTHPRIRELPMILETPIDDAGDQASDLQALRALLAR
jgi:deoxyribonuclease-4